MPTGCLYGSVNLCQQAREHAAYAVDELSGCVGQVLWMAPADVRAVAPGGTLPCYAVIDQLVVSTNSLLGPLNGLPTTITPTNEPEECSITIAAVMPTVERDDPASTTEGFHADTFLPSCNEPESVQMMTNVQTPGSPASGALPEPACTDGTRYVIDKERRDGKKFEWHKIFGNRNGSQGVPWKVKHTVSSTLAARITAGAEIELNIWVKKVKADIEVEASAERSWTHEIDINPTVPPGREGHIASIVFTKVVEGRTLTNDDCAQKAEFRRVRTPYKDYWDYWEEPYTGE